MRRPGRNTADGAVLLEAVIAVAVLLMAAITILGAVSQGMVVMERSRLALRAADLARSAMAEIEAGIATPETLNGPVRAEAPPAATDDDGPPPEFSDSLPPETGWELEIGVSPAPFTGLTKVTIQALKRRGEAIEASYSLHQLVRLTTEADDQAGEAGDLSRESDRGLRSREQGDSPVEGEDGP
jgi:hypothetical protein